MFRTQVYLTTDEISKLKFLAAQMGRKQSELIREAIDRFLLTFSQKDRLGHLQKAKGLWKGRTNEFLKEIRTEINQRSDQ